MIFPRSGERAYPAIFVKNTVFHGKRGNMHVLSDKALKPWRQTKSLSTWKTSSKKLCRANSFRYMKNFQMRSIRGIFCLSYFILRKVSKPAF